MVWTRPLVLDDERGRSPVPCLTSSSRPCTRVQGPLTLATAAVARGLHRRCSCHTRGEECLGDCHRHVRGSYPCDVSRALRMLAELGEVQPCVTATVCWGVTKEIGADYPPGGGREPLLRRQGALTRCLETSWPPAWGLTRADRGPGSLWANCVRGVAGDVRRRR